MTLARFTASLALLLLWAACSVTGARDLSELVLQDSTYLDPGTLEPFSGPVVRYFPDGEADVQLRGHLEQGTWEGELVVYHRNGRVRYQGDLSRGVKCGAWTENIDPDPPGTVYQQLKQEIESMGLYPPCPGK
jgi:hypothetical protein